jgi:hypothetical protein
MMPFRGGSGPDLTWINNKDPAAVNAMARAKVLHDANRMRAHKYRGFTGGDVYRGLSKAEVDSILPKLSKEPSEWDEEGMYEALPGDMDISERILQALQGAPEEIDSVQEMMDNSSQTDSARISETVFRTLAAPGPDSPRNFSAVATQTMNAQASPLDMEEAFETPSGQASSVTPRGQVTLPGRPVFEENAFVADMPPRTRTPATLSKYWRRSSGTRTETEGTPIDLRVQEQQQFAPGYLNLETGGTGLEPDAFTTRLSGLIRDRDAPAAVEAAAQLAAAIHPTLPAPAIMDLVAEAFKQGFSLSSKSTWMRGFKKGRKTGKVPAASNPDTGYPVDLLLPGTQTPLTLENAPPGFEPFDGSTYTRATPTKSQVNRGLLQGNGFSMTRKRRSGGSGVGAPGTRTMSLNSSRRGSVDTQSLNRNLKALSKGIKSSSSQGWYPDPRGKNYRNTNYTDSETLKKLRWGRPWRHFKPTFPHPSSIAPRFVVIKPHSPHYQTTSTVNPLLFNRPKSGGAKRRKLRR